MFVRQDEHARAGHPADHRARGLRARPATPGTRATRPAARAAARRAAVASGMVPVAHANDGGGSIRIPASALRAGRAEAVARPRSLAPDLGDVMGGLVSELVVTRSVRDTAAVLDVGRRAPLPGDPYTRRRRRGPTPRRSGPTRAGCASGCCTTPPGGAVRRAPGLRRRGRARRGARCSSRSGTRWSRRYPTRSTTRTTSRSFLVRWSAGVALEPRLLVRAATGRPIGPDDVEPLTWALAEMGRGARRGRVRCARDRVPPGRDAARLPAWWAGGFDLLLTPRWRSRRCRSATFGPDPRTRWRRSCARPPCAAFTARVQHHRPAGDLAAAALERGRAADRGPAGRRPTGARTCCCASPRSSRRPRPGPSACRRCSPARPRPTRPALAPGSLVAPGRRAVRGPRPVPSSSPARSHGLTPVGGAGGGAVSRMNCSIAAAMAAASSGVAAPRAQLDARAARPVLSVAGHCRRRLLARDAGYGPARGRAARLPARDGARRDPARARRSSACATASSSTPRGEWQMPPKIYLDAPPNGRLPRHAGQGRRDRDPQVGHVVPPQPARPGCRW